MAFREGQPKQKQQSAPRPAAPGAGPFDSSQHPRAGKGAGGGRFTSKGSAASSSEKSGQKSRSGARAAAAAAAAPAGKGKPRKGRALPRIHSAGLPKPPVLDPRRKLAVRHRSRGLAPMEISVSDQAPLTADPQKLAAMVAKAKALHVTNWRLVMEWGQVAGPDGLDFGEYDKTVNALRAAGISVQFAVTGTANYHPQWDQALSWQNADPGKARWFAQQVAAHFAGRVDRFSAWNEPNLPGDTFLKGGDKNPAKYRRLFQAMRDGFRAGDARARVGFGEVVPYAGNAAWLHEALKGVKGVGSVALHGYQDAFIPPENNTNTPDTLSISALDYARQVVDSSGARAAKGKHIPIDVTEMGYPAAPPSGVPAKEWEQTRARYMAQAIKTASSRDVRSFTIYQLFGTPQERVSAPSADMYGNVIPGARSHDDSTWDTSLITADGKTTPAFAAVAAAAAAVRRKPKHKPKRKHRP